MRMWQKHGRMGETSRMLEECVYTYVYSEENTWKRSRDEIKKNNLKEKKKERKKNQKYRLKKKKKRRKRR